MLHDKLMDAIWLTTGVRKLIVQNILRDRLAKVILMDGIGSDRGPEKPRDAGRGPERPREAQKCPERLRKVQKGSERLREAQRGPERPREAHIGP